jgi:restriction system protein
MAIPDFQTIMLPLLRHLQDGRERDGHETLQDLASEFHLSESEQAELLPSGRQPVFKNRIAWAKLHLKAAGLIDSPRRGTYRIAERGRQVVAGKPDRVDLRLLRTFQEYTDWRQSKGGDGAEPHGSPVDSRRDELTPEEHLEYGHQKAREDLAADMLQRLKQGSAAYFERVVVDLLIAMGYGGSRKDAGSIVGRGGDAGIDGVIKEDRLGLDIVYVQAKKWENTVGRPEIQKFAGALQGQRARKGVFITTAEFTKDAIDFASRIDSRIVLIDGKTLATFMIDHDVGVTTVASYQLKRLDSDYFDDGAV